MAGSLADFLEVDALGDGPADAGVAGVVGGEGGREGGLGSGVVPEAVQTAGVRNSVPSVRTGLARVEVVNWRWRHPRW